MRLASALPLAAVLAVAWLLHAVGREPENSRSVRAAATPAAPTAPERRPYTAVRAELADALAAWRACEPDASRARLRALAAELAREHGRPDAPRVVDHYLGLSPAERRQGLADEERWAELWRETRDADPTRWPVERPALLAALRRLADEVLPRADDLPAALALSLAARIEVRALEAGAGDAEQRMERAAADARRALAICERTGSASRALEPRWTLARVARLRGEDAEAERRYARLGEEARRVRNDAYREHALVARVHLARERGDVHGVDALLTELAGFRAPEQCWPLAREAAQRLLDEDRPARAEEFLLRTRPEAADELPAWRVLLAVAQLRQGETLRARAQLEALPAGHPDARLLEGQVLLAEGRPWEVLALWDAPDSRAALSPLARVVADTQLGEAWLAEGDPQRASAALESALSTASAWEARVARDRRLAAGGGSVAGEWLGLHAVVLAAEARLSADDPLAALVRAESWHARGLRDEALDGEDLAAWAARSEHGLLSLTVGADRGLALHLSAGGAVLAMEIPHARRELRTGVRRLREAARRDDEEDVRRLGAELARHLLPPGLTERIARSDDADERLLLLAHGPLEALPFELLVLTDGTWLDERATLHHLPGLPAPRPGTPTADPGPWDLLGDPRDASGVPLFPAAAAELAAVRAIHPGARLYARADFDALALLEALATPGPVHLATHLGGEAACEHPRFAPLGLALDGGAVLCAGEVADAPLGAELVVLASCESAGGRDVDAEGLQGLSRALLEGGVRDLLVSPWPVRDRAAAAWTPAFHAALADGASPARAARRARAALRAEGWPVSDWASFRLLGRE